MDVEDEALWKFRILLRFEVGSYFDKQTDRVSKSFDAKKAFLMFNLQTKVSNKYLFFL